MSRKRDTGDREDVKADEWFKTCITAQPTSSGIKDDTAIQNTFCEFVPRPESVLHQASVAVS